MSVHEDDDVQGGSGAVVERRRQRRNENEGSSGARRRRVNAERDEVLARLRRWKKMTVVLQPWVVCKNVSPCRQRQQRRSHLNTACPWQVLSAFLLLLLLLPFSQLPPSALCNPPLSSSFSFLLPHYTYSPRNMCTYRARRVGLTTCSRLLNCRLRPSFCTLARNSRLTTALGAGRPWVLPLARQKDERELNTSARSHTSAMQRKIGR